MRKLISTLFLLLISLNIVGQLTFVPDDNFEQALIDLGYDTGALDDFVPTANINTVTVLNVFDKSIADLTGIEDFTALTELSCVANQLTSLDLSQNANLISLNCSRNQLTSLNVTQNTVLETLNCFNNQLTSLDVTQNIALEVLATLNNPLGSLDVSQNIALTGLFCYNNSLTTLDLSANINLVQLQCFDNSLTSLDTSNNTALETLFCYDNQITDLDLTQNTALERLWSYNNQLTDLDVSQNPNLLWLDSSNNQLANLNVKNGNNTAIVVIRFDVTNNPDLTCIEVDDAVYSTANWVDIDATASFSETCETLSLADNRILDVKLYPNPTKTDFRINGLQENSQLEIYSLKGNHILKKGSYIRESVDISRLSSGIYFIKIINSNGSVIKRLIKQ